MRGAMTLTSAWGPIATSHVAVARAAGTGPHPKLARIEPSNRAGRGCRSTEGEGLAMSLLSMLVKGPEGKPSHPPLTDVVIGAYTVGVAMLVAGAAGLEEEAMAKGALLAISGGLIVTLPTAMTGVLDYLDLPKPTAPRTLAL